MTLREWGRNLSGVAGGIVLLVSVSRSAAFEPLGYGAAAKGMGGAYAAIAEDGTAAYWNPAGLARVKEAQGTASYEDLYGLGLLRYGAFGYTQPNVGKGTLSANLLHVDTEGDASFFNYAESTYMLSYGRKFCDGCVDLGTGFRYYSALGPDIKGTGLGFDLGAVIRPFGDRLRLGVMWQDLNRPRISWSTGAKDRLPYTVRASVAGRLTDATDLAFQYDNRHAEDPVWRFGGAQQFFKGMATLRAGLHRAQGQDQWNPSIGGGVRYKQFDFDYAWDSSDDLGNAQTFSVAMRFGK
jgi:hypothetical protein